MGTPTTRRAAEAVIGEMFGAPGMDWDTPDGEALLIGAVRERGLSALTDAAVVALALRHLDLECERTAARRKPADLRA